MTSLGETVSEEALMTAYAKGDKKAFEQLFRILGPVVHGFFIRRFGDVVIADDLLQVTFMKLHRARATYQEGAPVRPWLFTIAARVRLDELRKRGRNAEDANSEQIEQYARKGEDGDYVSGDTFEKRDVTEKVRHALADLPESQRVVIILHRYEGMTFDEIGKVLGTTEGAIKLRAFRAYEQLRKRLAPILGEERVKDEGGATAGLATAQPSSA